MNNNQENIEMTDNNYKNFSKMKVSTENDVSKLQKSSEIDESRIKNSRENPVLKKRRPEAAREL